ncbi:MBL fold metallo-hydrolase [Bacillus sp. OK048]|uniref:MBL fold metallo-hydrolase n=1 Tax=Bacillus sp. OK048 TaxID=1882761 RepID=UPI000B8564F2|nr:MBL fold metallo-hydrolase [Bacillus sp. OK048]
MTNKIYDLSNSIYLIDVFDLGLPNRTGTYVIIDDDITLVETGSSMSLPHILNGLKELEIDPQNVKNIIVTHIHLDHSGGVGLLLQDCPNAAVYVHSKGARHLIDPSRLKLGAKAVYGDDFDRLFEPILPVPEEKITIKKDGDILQIGKNRTLTFFDTPGHSDHHFCILDSVSNGIFTGDTLGMNCEEVLADLEIKLYLPLSSPNQFKPDATLDSLERIKKLNVDRIYFGHFGAASDVEEVYKQINSWLPLYVEIGEKAVHLNEDQTWIADQIFDLIKGELTILGVPDSHQIYDYLQIELPISAMGIADYFSKKNR